jgi:hypothetical protein
MKTLALAGLMLAATAASAQPAQDSDRTVSTDQAAYGEVRVADTVPCPRAQPNYSTSYSFPIRFQAPFANDRYAVIIGQSGAVSQRGENLSYTTSVSDRAREGMTITVQLRCTAGSRVLILTYAAIGRR